MSATHLKIDARPFAFELPAGRTAYVHVARGSLRVNERELTAGDAARLDDEATLVLEGGLDAEVLVFDLAR